MQKKHMGKLPGILILLAAAVSGCGALEENSQSAPEEQNMQQVNEITDQANQAQMPGVSSDAAEPILSSGNNQEPAVIHYEMSQEYEDIIRQYRTMLKEKWDYDQIEASGMSAMAMDFYELNPLKSLGYVLEDLNNDGIPELLIGETDTENSVNRIVLDAYTMQGSSAVKIFESAERNRYYVTKGEAGEVLIANEASNSAFNSAWLYYTFDGNELNIVQGIVFDASADEEHPWFMSWDDDWDTSNDEPVDEEMANSLIDAYTATYAALDWTPFG